MIEKTAFLIKTTLRATEPYNKSRLNLFIAKESYIYLMKGEQTVPPLKKIQSIYS